MKNKNILVFAAHPDDEVLGCSGTVAKLISQGNKVKAVFFTNGVSSRGTGISKKNVLERQIAAILVAKKLRCYKPTFYNFPDNALDTIPLLKIIKTIEKEIKKFNPSIIFTHFDKDLNIDHKIISTAVTTATRPISKKSNLEKILFFEVLSSTEWANFTKENLFSPNYFVNIENYIETKKELLKLYKKELKEWPHPRSTKGIEILSNYRGMACGKKNAEAFLVSKIFK